MKIKGKEEIRNTALDIIAYDGIEKLTMSYLANELGITKATLYHWYKSKEEILDDIYTVGHKSLMDKGFRLSLNGTVEDVLTTAANNWELLFSDEELTPYLRMIFSLHFTEERASEEYTALILMLKSQADVIIGSIKNGLAIKHQRILSSLFSSLLLSNLEKILREEDSNIREEALSFANLISSTG